MIKQTRPLDLLVVLVAGVEGGLLRGRAPAETEYLHVQYRVIYLLAYPSMLKIAHRSN